MTTLLSFFSFFLSLSSLVLSLLLLLFPSFFSLSFFDLFFSSLFFSFFDLSSFLFSLSLCRVALVLSFPSVLSVSCLSFSASFSFLFVLRSCFL